MEVLDFGHMHTDFYQMKANRKANKTVEQNQIRPGTTSNTFMTSTAQKAVTSHYCEKIPN